MGKTTDSSGLGVVEKTDSWLHYLALSVQPTFNVFSTIASAFDMKDIEELLISQRKILEESHIYKGA